MKKSPGTYDRAVPFAQTLALVPELRARYGVTRVADTTRLDRTGIPTFAAMVPHSPDMLGVYNGKGLTREAAIVSAVMEAVERQIGAAVQLPVFQESIERVCERLDIAALGPLRDAMQGNVECVNATELFTGDTIPVPLAMVQCPWFGKKLFRTSSTNGLASGNNVTEAIYHALCELVERHAWSMYHVRSSIAPRAFLGRQASDLAIASEIRFPCGDSVVDRIVCTIRERGFALRAFFLPEGDLPFTMLATISEPESEPPMAHIGLGCSLSPVHALTRALTEAVQSRVVDIQAAREDILRSDEAAVGVSAHGRRPTAMPTGQWCYDLPASSIELREIPDRSSDDIDVDLRATLAALRAYGIENVSMVDLSPVDIPISVVRAIVPGLEAAAVTGHLGPRARALLNPFAIASSV